MNWNRLALIAPCLCGSSLFVHHTITKALFTHTHVHSINIWAQETKHLVAMPTQHIQQLNSTPASVFKDPFLTFNPDINGKIRYHSQIPQHPVVTGSGKQTEGQAPQGKSGETIKAICRPHWGAERQGSIHQEPQFLDYWGPGPVLNPRDPKGSPGLTVWEGVQEQTFKQMVKQKNPNTQLWTQRFRNQQECGRDGSRDKKHPGGVHSPADSWRLILTDEREMSRQEFQPGKPETKEQKNEWARMALRKL